jgi:NADP-dependent 3-hydroxy acid dehydrogenase YdfG
MKVQQSGHIINVSSVAGHKVAPGGAVYSATKHAVRVISEGVRQEVKPYNIRTTAISPGAVATELPNSITDPEVAERMRKVLRHRGSRRLVREYGRICDEPAGRRGC